MHSERNMRTQHKVALQPVEHAQCTFSKDRHLSVQSAVLPVGLGGGFFAILHVLESALLSNIVNEFFIVIQLQEIRYLSHIRF